MLGKPQHPPQVGYQVFHADGMDGARGLFYNYVLAGRGLFIEAESPLLTGRAQIAEADVRGLPPLRPEYLLTHGKIPRYILELALGAMLATPDRERYLCVTYEGGYHVREPKQKGAGTSVEYERLGNVVMDLHSHGKMGAFFSGTDNKDEQGLRLFGVVGNLSGVLRMKMRLGIYGYFNQVELKGVFEDVPGDLIDDTVEPVEPAVDESIVLIPDYDPYISGEKYPGNIKPGEYGVVKLLRDNADNPEAVLFIADMLEE